MNENVYTMAFHALLSVQNIVLYLVAQICQNMLMRKNYSSTAHYLVCSFVDEPADQARQRLNEEELCMFAQSCHLFVNNLIYVHLNQFKKVIFKFLSAYFYYYYY